MKYLGNILQKIMKKTLFFLVAVFILCLGSLPLVAQKSVVVIDHMRLPEAGGANYLEVEQKIWKPIHQEYINQGKLQAWYLLSVPYPGGTDAEYHYMTVRVYKDMSQMNQPMADLEKVIAKVHPGKDVSKLSEQTLKSRDLVKTYVYNNWEFFANPAEQTIPEVIQMVYFNVSMDKTTAYMELESKHFHPTHKAEIEAGVRHGWSGLQLMRPYGKKAPYQFIALDFYKDWAQYIQPNPDGLFKKVFPEGDPATRDNLFMETAEIVNIETNRMVDYAIRAPVKENQASTKE